MCIAVLLAGNNNPVIASCRAESQAYVRELKEAHNRTKQELRFEKDKNAMLMSKALELEREKNALLAAQSTAAAPGLVQEPAGRSSAAIGVCILND